MVVGGFSSIYFGFKSWISAFYYLLFCLKDFSSPSFEHSFSLFLCLLIWWTLLIWHHYNIMAPSLNFNLPQNSFVMGGLEAMWSCKFWCSGTSIYPQNTKELLTIFLVLHDVFFWNHFTIPNCLMDMTLERVSFPWTLFLMLLPFLCFHFHFVCLFSLKFH